MTMNRTVKIALAVLALLVVAGGGYAVKADRDAKAHDKAVAQANAKRKRDRAAAERRRQARESRQAAQAAQAKAASCHQQLDGLVDVLSELDSRLDIGMNYHDYTDRVGDVKVAYDAVPFEELAGDFDCVSSVGMPAETAVNEYTKAADRWDRCFDDYACDVDAIEPSLRVRWDKATSAVKKAKSGLAELDTLASL
jgi:hypothetical protein